MKFTGYNSIKSWGVAVACSFVTFVSMLPSKVAGMLFVAFLSRYNTDRQNAAFSLVLNGVIASLISPLVGYLGEIFELRTLVVAGCLFSSAGVGICYFAEDILTVTICIGFLCGIGMSLQLLLLPQILKQHFTKNFATANGVTWIGCSIISFAVIPIVKLLLDIYGVSGALLITSGIMLHAVPVAMLLRDPEYKETTKSLSAKLPDTNGKEQKCGLFIDSDHIEKTLTNNPVAKNTRLVVETSEASNVKGYELSCSAHNTINCNEKSTQPYHQPNSFQSSINKKAFIDSDNNREQISINETKQDSFCDDPMIKNRNKYINALKALAILRNPPFLVIMFSLSADFYNVTFIVTIIVDISRDKGIPESQEQFLLMMLQVALIVGYTSLGYVADKAYLKVTRFLAITALCMGLSCCCFILSNSFAAMMVTVMCFGLCASVYPVVGPSLVYEFIEEKKQSMAIASRILLSAPLILTMGPLVKYFRGRFGSYNGILYLLAATCVTYATLLLLLPCIASCTNKKNKHERNSRLNKGITE